MNYKNQPMAMLITDARLRVRKPGEKATVDLSVARHLHRLLQTVLAPHKLNLPGLLSFRLLWSFVNIRGLGQTQLNIHPTNHTQTSHSTTQNLTKLQSCSFLASLSTLKLLQHNLLHIQYSTSMERFRSMLAGGMPGMGAAPGSVCASSIRTTIFSV